MATDIVMKAPGGKWLLNVHNDMFYRRIGVAKEDRSWIPM
jgi:hypothetical protein